MVLFLIYLGKIQKRACVERVRKNFNNYLMMQAFQNDLFLSAWCSVVSHSVFAAIRQFCI